MFAGDTHALLSGRGSLVGALFQAQECIFKLYHASVGEEQCSVIRRHERTAGDNGMAFAGKEVKKCATNLGRLHGIDSSSLHNNIQHFMLIAHRVWASLERSHKGPRFSHISAEQTKSPPRTYIRGGLELSYTARGTTLI